MPSLHSTFPESENEIGKSEDEIWLRFELEIFYCRDGCPSVAVIQPDKESSD